MNKAFLLLALTSGCALLTGPVAAQTCASPIKITSKQDVVGDTCAGTNTLTSYGGTGSQQNEIVYSFVAAASSATAAIAQTGGFAGSTVGVFLLPTCSSETDPTAFGVPGTPMVAGGLTPGQTYFIVVTADPGGPKAGCGKFDLDLTNGPVKPQETKAN